MWDFLKKYRMLLILLAIFVTLGTIVLVWKWNKNRNQEEEMDEVEETPTTSRKATITAEIYKYLTGLGINRDFALYIIAQSLHESGNYTSQLAVNYNNLFGMKQPQKRETLSKGPTPNGYASYENYLDSVGDLLLWLKEFNSPETFQSPMAYVAFLKSKGYFEDNLTTYNAAVNKHYNSIKYLS